MEETNYSDQTRDLDYVFRRRYLVAKSSLSLNLSLYVYVYICIYVCVLAG